MQVARGAEFPLPAVPTNNKIIPTEAGTYDFCQRLIYVIKVLTGKEQRTITLKYMAWISFSSMDTTNLTKQRGLFLKSLGKHIREAASELDIYNPVRRLAPSPTTTKEAIVNASRT